MDRYRTLTLEEEKELASHIINEKHGVWAKLIWNVLLLFVMTYGFFFLDAPGWIWLLLFVIA